MKFKGYKLGLITLSALIAGTVLLPTQGILHAENANAAQQTSQHSTNNNSSRTQDSREAVKKLIDQFANEKDVPGIIAGVTKNGQKWSYASGEATIHDKTPLKTNFHFRIGSATKTFVATVILQLAGENKLNLDDSIEKWLPGVVQGNGYDASKITIRQLLNHTSGIASYTANETFIKDLHSNLHKNYTTEELVRIGISSKPSFAPGTSWEYSNTNTVLAGLVIKKVTGETYGEQIKRRIIDPLKLKGTSVPGSSSHLPSPHARGYYKLEGKLLDTTEMNPSWGNAAGDMISTVDDLNTFFSALLGGELLKPELLTQMMTGVESPLGKYGLGIFETKLPNGTSFWGHGGNLPGFSTMAGGIAGGDHVMALSTNLLGDTKNNHHLNIITEEFSGTESKTKRVQNQLDNITKHGIVGVTAVTYNQGKFQGYASGKADITTGRKMGSDERFRIGSITKTFVATVVLQLAGENKLNLDDSVEKWLPGVVKGNGYDGNKVTIRQLLNHTSGINNYTDVLFKDPNNLESLYRDYKAEELVEIGLKEKPLFKPGTSFSYSNTNYVLLGQIIKKVTGETYDQQIEKRIIEPLNLNDTFLPGSSTLIPGSKHASGYVYLHQKLKDVTQMNPSWGNAAGDMISTGQDLSTFMSALLGGKLLKEEQLKQMLTAVKTEQVGDYGLGIFTMKLPNGQVLWGHNGGIHGYGSFAFGSIDGKHIMVLNINSSPDSEEKAKAVMESIDSAYAEEFK
ncbi:beta-lactamase family protein [Paenibacillus sp. SC116]|uniref:serine hydrolase domain-containing protein n=1 Tax=Paenibacillus sp. SC116 TaxID=2968986 RepID=UPI00215AB213|nr:serine hydrolase domain-containing protein [Paenibacillus sp. SC116]MCR8846335.1 beta-lactamase family protein [Paenibacillus sp. SC116]